MLDHSWNQCGNYLAIQPGRRHWQIRKGRLGIHSGLSWIWHITSNLAIWDVFWSWNVIESHGRWLTWNVLPGQFVCFRSEIGSSWQITRVRPLSVPNGLTSPSLKRLHKIWEENMEQVWQIFSARKTFLMTMTVSTTTMSVDNDACSNIWATNQSLYDIPLSPLSLILGTWSLSNLKPNWLLSLESPSNWADFESSRDDPSKVWRTLALSSAILGTWSLSPLPPWTMPGPE